jgi:pSer/pThr/pTyr-binding forkhead associated (FHA) protein
LSTAILATVDGSAFPLSAPEVIVDRAADYDLVLPDDTVSNRHAEIAADGVAYTVRDLGSHNGAWVNGRKLTTPCPL